LVHFFGGTMVLFISVAHMEDDFQKSKFPPDFAFVVAFLLVGERECLCYGRHAAREVEIYTLPFVSNEYWDDRLVFDEKSFLLKLRMNSKPQQGSAGSVRPRRTNHDWHLPRGIQPVFPAIGTQHKTARSAGIHLPAARRQ
jgi:hypothetical protein